MDGQPFIKEGGIGQDEASEEFAAHEFGRLFEPRHARGATVEVVVAVLLHFAQECLEVGGVEVESGGGELDGLAGDEEEGIATVGHGRVEQVAQAM